jgi:WD40 repeat protein
VNDSAQLCPECGLELPGEGGCPGCSLRLALSEDAAETLPPLPGLKSRFFGDYEILGEVARGGMGVVYRARQLGLNRTVALKMVQSQHLLSDEARLRFRVEIEAVAQLHHPHIVSLYESGEHDGAHYFTMHLVEGGDLSAHLQRLRPTRELVQLLVKVCRAVHYAHQRGILHRDLKPSNILVDEQGEPHVADFGLAKSLDHDTGFTFASSVLGSPNYMAPEQASGKVRQLSTAVDVYGLGAILYHVLTGVPPFQSKTPIDTLRQVIDRDPAPPRSIKPEIDVDLETIALKCLRKEPAGRYGTAEEMAQDLERWLDGQPILARPLGPWATAWRWSRRHPAAATLGAALVLSLAAIVVGTSLAAVRIRRAEEKSDTSLRESLLREAASFRLAGDLGNRAEALDRLREASTLGGDRDYRTRLRDELLATLARTDLAFVPGVFSNAPADGQLLRVDERFEQWASVEQGTNVLIRSVRDGTVLHRFISTNEPVKRIEQFSPDGQFLALRHTNSLSIWEVATGTRCLLHPGTRNVFSFAAHERTVLLQDEPNVAVLLELPSAQKRLGWTNDPSRPGYRRTGWQMLAFSRNGRMVAGASGTSHIVELMDAATGQPLRHLTNLYGHAVAMSWSRGGGALAVATYDGRIVSWNPATGQERWASLPMVAPARSIVYHPRGDWVAAVCEDNRVRLFDDLAQRFSVDFPATGEQIVFSPDGKQLAPFRSGGAWGSIQMQTPPEFVEHRVGSPGFRLDDARFSPDGRMLAVGHSDTVYLVDPEQGTRLRVKEDWRMFACAFALKEPLLFVTGPEGILRHRLSYSDRDALVISRREVIRPGDWRAFDFSAGGKFFVAYNVQSNRVFVFDHTLTNQLAVMGPHTNAEVVNISPDGRWVTTAGRADRTVRLWDVANQRLVFSKSVGVQPNGVFSADGRWLLLTGDREFHLLETGTWKPAPPLPLGVERPILGVAAFSPDSRVLAVVVNKFTVQLIDLEKFASLGTLRAPGTTHRRGLAFSADGSRLAAVGPEARVAIWDLRALENRLKEFGVAQESFHVRAP